VHLAARIFTVAAAPFVGSFIGVLVSRLPAGESVIAGRSRCGNCGHALAARDLVPLASWILLRGRCRYCRAPIGALLPLIEAAALLIALWAALQSESLESCVFGWLLLALGVIDWRSFILPNPLTLSLAVSGLGFALSAGTGALRDRVIGAAAGFLVFAAIAALYRHRRGREGLGRGDAKLLGGIGAWVSWQGLPLVVALAAAAALLMVAVRAAAGQPVQSTDRISFGPFLAGAAWIIWLYGPLLIAAAS